MSKYTIYELEKTQRIERLIDGLFKKKPEIEVERAVLLTESFRKTEGEAMVMRRAKAFAHILENLPIIIRDDELVVGSATKSSRSCQIFPEFSFQWIEDEFDTISTRSADPFDLSEESKTALRDVFKYWKGKTTSELATSYMTPEALTAIKHNVFTVGNYFYNGVGHITADYAKVLKIGYRGIINEAKAELAALDMTDPEIMKKGVMLKAVIISCEAACAFAKRYARLALEMAEKCTNQERKLELLHIAKNCANVPENGAQSFYEACQSFWFVQLLIQTESNGHSISPGRFDQYMYPYYKADMDAGKITPEEAQELVDCVWVKLNDFTKVRDKASAEGFAGYSLFQNLIAGGQDKYGEDATNDLSFMCIQASMHVGLPQPSLSVRIWNKTPHDFMMKAAELTRTGIGLPAYYNDEVIIPSLMSRGLTLQDARDYNIIGCVEPQKSGKTQGWHDAAFYNMLRPLELVFSQGMESGERVGPDTGDVTGFKTFDEFYNAYKAQSDYMVKLLVNADNAIDIAHSSICPLPYLSSMVNDCIKNGRTVEEGGAVYNFSGPQGFGVANMADAMFAVKKLVFDEKKLTMQELKDALTNNFGVDLCPKTITKKVALALAEKGVELTEEKIKEIYLTAEKNTDMAAVEKYNNIREMILEVPKYGNDSSEVDALAREVAYVYTKEIEKYKNPRGGQFQAGLYPVSANVPLGAQTGATPDGRLAFAPIADGVSPTAGRDVNGPTASANSVSKLDHYIASNGTLFNMKFHPSALKGQSGLESFCHFVRTYFDQKGSHMQFNVVSRETLIDAQKHPENYKNLVVRVAGYSALFTTLSRSLQDDIINRTEQGGI